MERNSLSPTHQRTHPKIQLSLTHDQRCVVPTGSFLIGPFCSSISTVDVLRFAGPNSAHALPFSQEVEPRHFPRLHWITAPSLNRRATCGTSPGTFPSIGRKKCIESLMRAFHLSIDTPSISEGVGRHPFASYWSHGIPRSVAILVGLVSCMW